LTSDRSEPAKPHASSVEGPRAPGAGIAASRSGLVADGTGSSDRSGTSEPTVVAQRCGDCGTAFSGNYCPNCGQEARIALPRVGEFLREMLDETVGISGRLPRTLYTLLFKPARLTIDYLAGRRQRYVRPMRLYLSVSVVYFAMLQLATSDIGWISLQDMRNA